MKKEKKKLSQKEIENIKLKRKKVIAKIINIFVWVYAIGVSLLLVVGSACSRSYSGASAETIEYENDNILFDYSHYNKDVEYRFYWSIDKLKLLKKASGVFNNNVIYKVPARQWWYNSYSGGASLVISDISNITNYDKLHISNDLYLVGINAQCSSGLGTTFKISYYCYDVVSQLYSTQVFLRSDITSGNSINGFPVNIYGGYYDINYYNALVELMSGNYIIDTHSLNVAPGTWSDFGLLILGLFSQYSIQNVNANMPTYWRYFYLNGDYLQPDIIPGYSSPNSLFQINYSDLLFNYSNYEIVNNYVIRINNITSDFYDYKLDTGIYYYGGIYYDSIYIKYYHLNNGDSIKYSNLAMSQYFPGYYYGIDYTASTDNEYVPLCIYLYHNNGTNSLENDIMPFYCFTDFDYKVNDGLNTIYWTNIKDYINPYFAIDKFNIYYHSLGLSTEVSTFYKVFEDIISLDSDFDFVIRDNTVHINDGIDIYAPYSTTFDLINIAFGGMFSLMGYYILPGISIGALLMVPMVLTLVLVVVKMFKR